MLLIDWLNKHKAKKENLKYIKLLNGYGSTFGQFGSNIYADVSVQQAIRCICQEMKKLSPQHVIMSGSDIVPVPDDIQRTLDNPNEMMTTSDFIEKIVWSLFFNYNAFILPVWQDGKLVALYPLQPSIVEFLQDGSGRYFVKFKFYNDYQCTVRYSDIIHIRYNYSVNDLMGGDNNGQPDNKALLKSLELNKTLLDGVSKAMKSSFAINGVVKYNTIIDGKKTEEALNELTTALRNNESGFMPLDLKGEFIPFKRDIQLVDADTLKFVDEKILRHFGVSLPILTGDYTKEQYEAFYQKTIEPLTISIGQAFTKGLFSVRESNGFGHRVVFYAKELIFMNTTQKIELFKLLVDTSSCYSNELRTAFGMHPLPELVGQMAIGSQKQYAENDSVDKNKKNSDNKNSEEVNDGEA